MIHSNRDNDSLGERALVQYLDKYFYPRMDEFEHVERTIDINEQYNGIDVKAIYNGSQILIDEKGYLSKNKIMPTFAFEVSSVNRDGVRREGWLYNTDLTTTHFLICWNKRNEDIELNQITVNDFHYINAMLIEKKKIHHLLENKYKINRKAVNQSVHDILADETPRVKTPLIAESKASYHYSDHLGEKPINIVLSRKELSEIAEFYKCIKKSAIIDAE